MPKTQLKRRVMHRPDDMLAMVADVERYPKFIKFISALRVKNRQQISEYVEHFEAEATVSFKFVSENFSSDVQVDRQSRTISVKKSGRGGALKSLENSWKFHELSDGSTLVEFYVDVSLKAFPLNMLLADKFDKVGSELMRLFEHKAGLAFEKVGDPELNWEAEVS